MDMKEEMMNDALDDALGDEDDEEERYIASSMHVGY
jgi:charged multivesicular body protein 2A